MKNTFDLFQHIPDDLTKFILVTVFALLIGLEQRRHYLKEAAESRFGTDRTFTLIGILGFILYRIAPNSLAPFLGGGAAIAVLLAVFYFQKMAFQKKFGITSQVTALITYCLAPLVYTQPAWLVLLIVVAVLVLTEIKESLFEFSQKFDDNEFVTLAKFLVIAGVILPLLPDQAIAPEINVTPYNFWLAIVAVSGISYLSYLLRKFVFPHADILLTGILGGLYSSTATTFILARQSRERPEGSKVTAAIILATTMMFVRIWLLAFLFNRNIAWQLAPSFGVFIVVSAGIAAYFYHIHPNTSAAPLPVLANQNPLEFKTSLIFALLFLFFALATGFVSTNYGALGIKILSFIVGVTDIDPFLLNLFQSKWNMTDAVLIAAVINAVTSNNLLKMSYGIALCDKAIRWQLAAGFGILIALGILADFIFYF